jgi:hypothetical protein
VEECQIAEVLMKINSHVAGNMPNESTDMHPTSKHNPMWQNGTAEPKMFIPVPQGGSYSGTFCLAVGNSS